MSWINIYFMFFGLAFIFGTLMADHVGFAGDIVKKNHKFLLGGGTLDDILLYPYSLEGSNEQIVRKGQFAHYGSALANVIICHGFSCDHHDVAILRYVFDSGKYNVLSFDFRAHGELDQNADIKQYCTFGKDEVLDLSAAIDFIKQYPDKTIAEKPIFIYGFSMGAAVAIETTSRYPGVIKGLVLDCPFDSSYHVVKRGLNKAQFELFGYQFSLPCVKLIRQYAFHPYVQSILKPLLKFVAHFDTQNIETNLQPVFPVKSIKSVEVPILYIHCKNDEKIPLEAVMKLYQKTPGIKRLWITGGKRHFGSFFYRPEAYKLVIQTFVDNLLAEKDDASEVLEKVVFDDGSLDNEALLSSFEF